jgi:hypothetical protein
MLWFTWFRHPELCDHFQHVEARRHMGARLAAVQETRRQEIEERNWRRQGR